MSWELWPSPRRGGITCWCGYAGYTQSTRWSPPDGRGRRGGVCCGAGRKPETDCRAGRSAGRGGRVTACPRRGARGRGAGAPAAPPPGGRRGRAAGQAAAAPPGRGRRRPAPPAGPARPPAGRPAGAAQRPGRLRQDHPAGPVAGRPAAAGGLGHPGRPRRRGGRSSTHLVAALRPRFPGAGRATLGLLRLPGAVAPADLGAALAEDLAALDGEAVVVLDDYQEVRDGGVHAVLDALLRAPPAPAAAGAGDAGRPAAAPGPAAGAGPAGGAARRRPALHPRRGGRLPGPRPPRAARAGDRRRR